MTAPTATEKTARTVGDPIEALVHFFILATTESHSGARVAARLLLGLYNGNRFEFDLTDLRLLDASNLRRALALLEFDARAQMEVHAWLNRIYSRSDFGMRFEHMAHKWDVKGKCRRACLDKVPAVRFGGYLVEATPCA